MHGFTQTSACWSEFGRLLARSCEVVPIDAPGHGAGAPVVSDLWQAGSDLAARLGGGTLLGYSMGGRIALHAALAGHRSSTGGIDRLVLISATAGIDDDAERAARRRADDALADRVEAIGVEEFVDEWLTAPMFSRLPPDPECLAARRSNTATGLAMSLRTCGVGTQDPLWHRLGDLTMPVLIVAGADDEKFTTLAHRLADGIAHSELAVVPSAGHACHSERPAAVAEIVVDWLSTFP